MSNIYTHNREKMLALLNGKLGVKNSSNLLVYFIYMFDKTMVHG